MDLSEKELDTLNHIAVKIGRMEERQEAQAGAMGKLAYSIDKLVEKLDKSDDTAVKAEISARSAHKRLDAHDSIIRWTATTIIGAVILAIMALAFKGGL